MNDTSRVQRPGRRSSVRRVTGETDTRIELVLDGSGDVSVSTGIGFLDHMLGSLAFHAGFDLMIECEGDLAVDDHHTAEDVALALGQALGEALGDMSGIARFGEAFAPLDESLARAVIDLSGRPHASVELRLERDSIGGLAAENASHFFRSLASAARITLHVDVLRGENDHHRIEAAFKSTALALRRACAPTGSVQPLSTKGVLV